MSLCLCGALRTAMAIESVATTASANPGCLRHCLRATRTSLSREFMARPLPSVLELSLHIEDALFIPLIEGPLLDPLRPKQTHLDEDTKMLTGSGLSNT